jgi:hypothetical protein
LEKTSNRYGLRTWEEGTLQVEEKRAHLVMGENDESSCRANFALVGNFLLVSDSGKCGGMNVNFNNVYTKAPNR